MNDPMTPEQVRAEVTAEFVAWLVKKAREHRVKGPQYAKQADVIVRLADKVQRGAVRPNNLLSLPPQGGPEDIPALRAELDQLRKDLESYEVLNPQQCPAGKHADWLVDSEHTHTCPWCELEARPSRTKVLREAAELGRELSRQGYSAQEIAKRLDRMADEAGAATP